MNETVLCSDTEFNWSQNVESGNQKQKDENSLMFSKASKLASWLSVVDRGWGNPIDEPPNLLSENPLNLKKAMSTASQTMQYNSLVVARQNVPVRSIHTDVIPNSWIDFDVRFLLICSKEMVWIRSLEGGGESHAGPDEFPMGSFILEQKGTFSLIFALINGNSKWDSLWTH